MVGLGGRVHVKRCHTCRRRKVKCDGESPACQRCIDLGFLCPGYQRKLEFVHFETEPVSKGNVSAPAKTFSDAWRSSDTVKEIRPKSTSSRDPEAVMILDRHHMINAASDHSLAVPQNRSGFMAILRERYVPELPKFSCERGYMNGANWIATACTLSASPRCSEMLSDSLLAMSLSVVGLERQEGQLNTASLKKYSRALNGLRSGLASGRSGLSQDQMDVSLATSLSCGMYEASFALSLGFTRAQNQQMINNRSVNGLMQHLNGMSGILQICGVENLQSDSSRRTFYEYRSICLPIALIKRKANFLSSPEWINPSWKQMEPLSSSRTHTMCGIGFQIPVLMEKFDILSKSEPEMTYEIISSQLSSLILEGLSVQQAFDEWEHQYRSEDEATPLYTLRRAKPMYASELDDGDSIYPISFKFANWDIALGLIYHEMLQIFLNTLLIDIAAFARRSQVTPPALSQISTQNIAQKSIECADRICQSIEYFFEDHKRLIGRLGIIAPFESARALFAKLCRDGMGDVVQDAALMKKRKFCDAITRRIRQSGQALLAEGVEENCRR